MKWAIYTLTTGREAKLRRYEVEGDREGLVAEEVAAELMWQGQRIVDIREAREQEPERRDRSRRR